MIFLIDSTFVQQTAAYDLARLVKGIMAHHHFISCEGEGNSMQAIVDKVKEELGKTELQQLLNAFQLFSPTQMLKNYLTVIECHHYPMKSLLLMVEKPSRILIENELYEWPVYCYIMDAYKNDPIFKNLFKLLHQAERNRYLLSSHAGGKTQMGQLADEQDKREYRQVARFKWGVLFDRDSNDEHSFASQSNALFRFFWKGKEAGTMTNADVYDLKPTPSGYWVHVWYKREIENYFPDSQIQKCHLSIPSTFADSTSRNYTKLNLPKDALPNLPKGMNRKDFEATAEKFIVDGKLISEFQLLLLKWVKLI